MFLVQIFSLLFRTVHHFFCSFGAVSCLFSNSLVSFERLAPCAQNSLTLLERYAPVFSNSLMPFGRFAPFLKLCSLFRAVCCFFLQCLVRFERFAPFCSNSQVSFAWFARFSLTLACFAWFVLSSHILVSLSSGLLRFLKFPRPCRTDCSAFCNCLIAFEGFASQLL